MNKALTTNLTKGTGEKPSTVPLEIKEYSYEDLKSENGQVILRGLIDVYKDSFGDEPWREWKKCVNKRCEMKLGKEEFEHLRDKKFCPSCLSLLSDFHTFENVNEILKNELTIPGTDTFLFTAKQNGCIVGLCWGYGDSASNIIRRMFNQYQEYFGDINDEEKKKITESALCNLERYKFKKDKIFYFSQLAVLKEFRGGVAMPKLLETTAKKMVPLGYDSYLFWTNKGKKFDKVTRYKEDDYVIMAGNARHVFEVLTKPENQGEKLHKYLIREALEKPFLVPELIIAQRNGGAAIYSINLLFGGKEIVNNLKQSGKSNP